MALTEREELLNTSVLDTGVISVRFDLIIDRDGGEVSRISRKQMIDVDTDYSMYPQQVKDIVALIHTPEWKVARQALLDAQNV